ncbi:type II secretion system F family protein [Patescibacteria group bacterium]|nr:type II secretion system F family protein [Patescibacteria group bacterium]
MRFTYKARTKEGKMQRGTIEASSRKACLNILEKYGFYVTFLKETGKGGFLMGRISLRRISPKDIVAFSRQFSVMLKSAIPPVEALRAQVAQTENPDFREKILKMAEVVETGSTLSQAFSLYHPEIFDPFFVNIVKSGEATGKVADSLTYLADHLEREYNLSQKIRGAMIYPGFVIVVFIAAFFLVTFFIIPRLIEVLEAFGGKLPLSTRLMISLSEFVRKGGWILIFLIFGALFFLPQYLKRAERSKKFYDRVSLKIPILGDFYKKIYLVQFCENLSVLIRAGLPITQALKITEGIIGSVVYKKIIRETQERVARGERISSVLSQYPEQIPTFVTQMTSTGEETGRLEQTLMNVVDFYRAEIERTTDNLTSILEPILIVVLGVGIGILAVSVFIPLFRMGFGGVGM